jgi:uncharacterized repeat protein (TIGR01451 family)
MGIDKSFSPAIISRKIFRAVTLLIVGQLLLLVPFSLAQAAPVFQATGAAVNGQGAVSPAWPAHAVDDVALLLVETTGGEAVTLSTTAGFVAIANSPQDATGTRLTVFWARATSTAMGAPTVADPGDHAIAQIVTYRGVIGSGDPWDVTGGGVKTAVSTSLTASGVTTSVDDTLVVVAASQDNDTNTTTFFSTWTNANLTSGTERSDFGKNSGDGGGFGIMDGGMATAGATGNTTATLSASSTNAFLTIALKPPVAGAATQLAFSQEPTNKPAGEVITPAVTVEIRDAGGTLVTTATDTVTLAIGTDPSGGTAAFSGTLSVAAVAGVATFSDLSIDTGGTGYTLTASATGLTGATSGSFDISTPSGTYGATDCAGSRFGSDLVCTANDVSITGIAVVPGGPTACIGGESITIDIDVTVNFATPSRWDVGIFLATDGKSPEILPANGGSSRCTVAVLDTPTVNPTTSFLDLDPGPWDGVQDTCGDGNSTIGSGTGSGVQRVTSIPVACQAVDLSGGRLYIPFLTSWDNQQSPSGSTCTSNLNPVPNTKSKCNVPDGTVLADVLSSTVALVVMPSITKTDTVASITAGDSTAYDVTITNTTGATLSNAIFQDPAVANLTVDSLACSAAGGATCPASLPISTMQGGGIIIPDMPVNSSVTFTITATVSGSAPAGPLTNTAIVTVDAESNTAEDTNDVITKLVVAKSFDPPSISVDEETALTITLQNTNLAAATGVAFTDTYPANLFNAAVPAVTNTCGGSVTAAGGGSSLALSGGTIPAGGSCTITAQVTSAIGGVYNNSTGAVSSAEGYVGDAASASLAVSVSNLSTSSKSWQDLNGGEPDPGDTIRYTVTIVETANVAATNVSLADTVADDLTGLTVVSCPAGATCGFSGQALSATNITVPANGFVSVVFDATIPLSTTPGTTISNCASITNPGGIGASPCAATLIVSPSAIAGAGNKLLYLHDVSASYKLSRAKPSSAQNSVTVSQSSSQQWTLSPALASPVTISPDVTPLAIIPVNLYLASGTANETRSVQVAVACSGGGPTYSESKIFDGTAVNNPYLPTTPTQVSFNNLTVSGDHFCSAGQTWNLTVNNIGTGSVIVHPTSGTNNSFISLPSLNIINVDSVTGYDAPYAATTSPASGYFSGGQTVYLRAVVSDPFGSFDITAAAITIEKPNGTAVVTGAAMTEVADSGTLTKIYEYAYILPITDAGSWTVTVTAEEGNEGAIADDGAGAFNLGLPDISLTKIVQTFSDPVHGETNPYAIPGAVMRYTILTTNFGYGSADADSVTLTDPIPAQTDLQVSGTPVTFNDGTTASGLTFSAATDVAYYDASDTPVTPTADANGVDPAVRKIVITPQGTFLASDGADNPSFTIVFNVRVR